MCMYVYVCVCKGRREERGVSEPRISLHTMEISSPRVCWRSSIIDCTTILGRNDKDELSLAFFFFKQKTSGIVKEFFFVFNM